MIIFFVHFFFFLKHIMELDWELGPWIQKVDEEIRKLTKSDWIQHGRFKNGDLNYHVIALHAEGTPLKEHAIVKPLLLENNLTLFAQVCRNNVNGKYVTNAIGQEYSSILLVIQEEFKTRRQNTRNTQTPFFKLIGFTIWDMIRDDVKNEDYLNLTVMCIEESTKIPKDLNLRMMGTLLEYSKFHYPTFKRIQLESVADSISIWLRLFSIHYRNAFWKEKTQTIPILSVPSLHLTREQIKDLKLAPTTLTNETTKIMVFSEELWTKVKDELINNCIEYKSARDKLCKRQKNEKYVGQNTKKLTDWYHQLLSLQEQYTEDLKLNAFINDQLSNLSLKILEVLYYPLATLMDTEHKDRHKTVINIYKRIGNMFKNMSAEINVTMTIDVDVPFSTKDYSFFPQPKSQYPHLHSLSSLLTLILKKS